MFNCEVSISSSSGLGQYYFLQLNQAAMNIQNDLEITNEQRERVFASANEYIKDSEAREVLLRGTWAQCDQLSPSFDGGKKSQCSF